MCFHLSRDFFEVAEMIRSGAVGQPDIKDCTLAAALGNDKCLKQRVVGVVATSGQFNEWMNE